VTVERWDRPLDALFLSPHPDDVELFCGGTVARLAAAGLAVGIADLSAGEAATNGTVEQRRRASIEASRILGALAPRPVLGLPDGGLRGDDPEQTAALVALLRGARPRVLFAPWTTDRHPDHEAAGWMARRARFLAGVGGDGRPAALLHYPCHLPTTVQVAVDVTAQRETWRAAVETYAEHFIPGEGRKPTFINRPDFLLQREARRREIGALCGVEEAEGYVLEGPVLLGEDLVEILGVKERP
jgi:bacillithiol biosynthesis deacetylase BshB1